MRTPEPLPSGRWKVRHRVDGRQTSRTFATLAEAAQFADVLRRACEVRARVRVRSDEHRRAIVARVTASPSGSRPGLPPPLLVVPAGPLLARVDRAGGPAAFGLSSRCAERRALERTRMSGVLTEQAADALVTRVLGLTLGEVWPGA